MQAAVPHGNSAMAATAGFVTEPERRTPVGGEYDVVVLGGGPAGIAAAAAPPAHGRKTLLVERYGFLGGMGTAAGVTNFCGLHANVLGEHPPGRARRRRRPARPHRPARRPERAASRLRQDRRRRPTTPPPTRSPPTISCSSRGVDMLFHAFAVGVVMDARRHASTRCSSKRSPAAGRCGRRCSSTAPATAISPPSPARASSKATDGMLYPTHDVPRERRRSDNAPAKPGRRFRR